jgi:hypothetical protein
MRIFGWSYRIVVLLASLVVVYAMFHAAQTEFETIVVCALVLVYCAVVWNAIVLGGLILVGGLARGSAEMIIPGAILSAIGWFCFWLSKRQRP